MDIEIKNITKKYGKKKILNGISINAKGGQCVGILGANGSGKSTFLSILAGVLKPDVGEFLCDKNDILKSPKMHSEIIGYVPQGIALIEELTARDNLLLWYTKEQIKKELSNGKLSMLGIGEFIDKCVLKMSGGMKKRLSIACSISGNPKILLMDEPTAALDLPCKKTISDYIVAFKKAGGTVIIATHDAGELSLCDSMYILKEGNLTSYEFDGDVNRLVDKL